MDSKDSGDSNMTLDMRKYKNIIKRGKWIIILITLLSTIAGVKFSINPGEVNYFTDETIIIGQENDATNNQNLIKTYIEIAKSNSVAEKASAKLNGAVSPIEIENAITINIQLNTSILKITTSTPDKKQTLDIINAVSDSFIEESHRIYPNGKTQIMDYAKEPQATANKFNIRNTGISFLIGLIASMSILLLMNYMDTTIKNEDNMEQELGLPVIGNIQKYKVDQ
ncbi:hypothetical protein G9F72_015495 [Clostridium estertheticum]|uniref:YveK family protein n=1 Tax=Clostridium estertheticum TaxID=238834 RepID=UPI0013E91254|nr:Wzz/FepE/Etk N-terminal domain-containing protein [Clostridium estertheticum]MBZ9687736.1 hypothetical protein [Clostridium estertheticum]